MNNIKLLKYGFNIEVDFDKRFSGLYWEALSNNQREIGKIDYKLLEKNSSFFIETSFSPEYVNLYPIRAISGFIPIDYDFIFPGKWKLRFVNLINSLSSIQFFGAKQNSYDGVLLVPSIFLDDSKIFEFEFSNNCVFDKFFVKKNNYSSDPIIISDFSLSCGNNIFISDQSLIKPEHENIKNNSNKIVFEKNSPIWSFFTIKFYKP